MQLGTTFASTPQCDHGVGQAHAPIYLETRPDGSKSHINECAGLEQPSGPNLS
jgi:hypothetical protein